LPRVSGHLEPARSALARCKGGGSLELALRGKAPGSDPAQRCSWPAGAGGKRLPESQGNTTSGLQRAPRQWVEAARPVRIPGDARVVGPWSLPGNGRGFRFRSRLASLGAGSGVPARRRRNARGAPKSARRCRGPWPACAAHTCVMRYSGYDPRHGPRHRTALATSLCVDDHLGSRAGGRLSVCVLCLWR
jgi:hypothetical protein